MAAATSAGVMPLRSVAFGLAPWRSSAWGERGHGVREWGGGTGWGLGFMRQEKGVCGGRWGWRRGGAAPEVGQGWAGKGVCGAEGRKGLRRRYIAYTVVEWRQGWRRAS
jgi:hypothetical protein